MSDDREKRETQPAGERIKNTICEDCGATLHGEAIGYTRCLPCFNKAYSPAAQPADGALREALEDIATRLHADAADFYEREEHGWGKKLYAYEAELRALAAQTPTEPK